MRYRVLYLPTGTYFTGFLPREFCEGWITYWTQQAKYGRSMERPGSRECFILVPKED